MQPVFEGLDRIVPLAAVAAQKARRRSAQQQMSPGKARASRSKRKSVPASCLIVGIGASAGGLDAFKAFFAGMPADSGMAFVLVQHLDPHHKSMLVELLGRHTAMPVVAAIDGVRVTANRIFIIPPNATLSVHDSILRVSKPAPVREHRRPIDTFFVSLAVAQRERAVCVVLSGTGSDGTLGVRKIKEHGGLTLAQADCDTTAMGEMPQSAAATGLVDHLVPVGAMPGLLLDYQRHLQTLAAHKNPTGQRRDMPAHTQFTDPIDVEIRRVMEQHSPAFVVIDRYHEILRFSGGAVGRYLEPSPGTASLNLFDIVRKALRPTVRTAVRKAYQTNESHTTPATRIRIDGKNRSIKLILEPIAGERGAAAERWVVAFQETVAARTGKEPKALRNLQPAHVGTLEQELQTAKTQLRATIDELECSNEEMKSANQEYQSVNEELQSSNQELETAKEEMHSVNQELQAINAQMSGKNEMLTRLNSNLKNLLDGTQIATIFLDNELRITYFTPAMTGLFHLRDSDYGRPITDLVTRMHYADLRRDLAHVVRTLAIIEREVWIDADATAFLMRIRPYRSVDEVIEGVVITFVDITDRKRHEETRAQLAAIVDSSQDAIISHTLDGTIVSWNAGAQTIFGYTAAEAIGKPYAILIPENQGDDVLQILDRLKRGERLEHFEIDRVRKDGQTIDVSLSVSPIKDVSGRIVAAATIAREFTERKLAEEHKSMMIGELDHRIQNTLAVISSLIRQTARNSESLETFSTDIEGRLQAFSRVQTLLNHDRRDRVALRDIIVGELHPYELRQQHRIVIDGGTDVVLTAPATQALAMALHELATNAAKYGALSTPAGKVEVRWRVVNATRDPQVAIEWRESDGPPVRQPARYGFGSQLIERMVGFSLKAKVQRDFRPEGLQCKIEFPLREAGQLLTTQSRSKG